MPAGLWVVQCACQAAPGDGAWVQGRHFTAFGGRGGVLRADVKKPRRWVLARCWCGAPTCRACADLALCAADVYSYALGSCRCAAVSLARELSQGGLCRRLRGGGSLLARCVALAKHQAKL